MELTTYLQNLVFLIGFGIAIDYSLLVVYRYREEHREGVSKEDAVVKTMATAGRAVVFSGSAVGIGLALMLFMPLPFMRGFGIGGLAIPVVSIVAAITLLPVLLYLITGPLDRVRLLPKRITERREAEENFWVKLARAIMRRPVWFAVGTTALLLALAAPALALELGPGSNEGIPKRLESVQGLDVMATAVGKGALAPTTVVIDTGEEMGVRQPEVQDATRSFVARLTLDPEVARVDFEPSSQYIEPPGASSASTSWGSTSTAIRRPPTSSTGCATRSSRSPASQRAPPSSQAADRQAGSTSSTSPTAPSRGSCSACCSSPTSCSCARSARCSSRSRRSS